MAVIGEAQFAVVNFATSGDHTVVAAQGVGIKIRVLAWGIIAAAALVANVQSGAGGTSLTGPMTMAAGIQIGGDFSPVGHLETAANALLNINTGGAVQLSGWIVWAPVS